MTKYTHSLLLILEWKTFESTHLFANWVKYAAKKSEVNAKPVYAVRLWGDFSEVSRSILNKSISWWWTFTIVYSLLRDSSHITFFVWFVILRLVGQIKLTNVNHCCYKFHPYVTASQWDRPLVVWVREQGGKTGKESSGRDHIDWFTVERKYSGAILLWNRGSPPVSTPAFTFCSTDRLKRLRKKIGVWEALWSGVHLLVWSQHVWRLHNFVQKIARVYGMMRTIGTRAGHAIQSGVGGGGRAFSRSEKWMEKHVNGTQGGSRWINRSGDSPFLGLKWWLWAGLWGTQTASLNSPM